MAEWIYTIHALCGVFSGVGAVALPPAPLLKIIQHCSFNIQHWRPCWRETAEC
jgi:hypothetical protein